MSLQFGENQEHGEKQSGLKISFVEPEAVEDEQEKQLLRLFRRLTSDQKSEILTRLRGRFSSGESNPVQEFDILKAIDQAAKENSDEQITQIITDVFKKPSGR